MTPRRSARFCLAVISGIIAAGVAADQITKALALARLDPYQPVSVVSDLFELRLVRNPGAAFSTGTSVTPLFSALAVAVLVAVSIWVVPKVRCLSWAVVTGLGMAGIAGNFIDRLVRPPGFFRGYVIDFFSLKYFAVFNVADILLTTAAVLIVVLSVFVKLDLSGSRTAARAA